MSNRKDVQFILGPLDAKIHSKGTRSEILISELYPARLKYSSKTELLVVRLDYNTKVQKIGPTGEQFEGNFKPTEQARRDRQRQTELDERRAKSTRGDEDDFIDHANAPVPSRDFWNNHEFEARVSSRNRTKCV